jgi:hypothetical protein
MKTVLVILGFICVLGLVISLSKGKEDDPLKKPQIYRGQN